MRRPKALVRLTGKKVEGSAAPGKYYTYRATTGGPVIYEVKENSYSDTNNRWFDTHERAVWPETGLPEFVYRWRDSSGQHQHVTGWYNTLEEAIFAMEVLL